MSKITNVIAALVVSLTLSSVASASVITTGTLEYDNVSNVITDNVSGETYLGWDMAKDLNYAQTVAVTTGVGLSPDWHIASQAEAYSFYNAATGAGIADVSGIQDFSANIGAVADGVPFGDSFNGTIDVVFFLGAESEDAGFILSDSVDGLLRFNDGFASFNDTDYFSTSGDAHGDSQFDSYHVSWLLVGGTAAVVPEPSIIALFGLGLVGIGFAHRKCQS
jgi:hypothetical protein